MHDDLMKNVNMEEIVRKGTLVYDEIKSQYLPQDEGKILAIDPDTKDVFFGETTVEAVELGRKAHPDTVFYVVRIGHSYVETLIQMKMRNV